MNFLPNVALVALTLNRKYIFKSHTSVLLQNLPGIQQVWKLAYACSCSAFWSLKSCGLKLGIVEVLRICMWVLVWYIFFPWISVDYGVIRVYWQRELNLERDWFLDFMMCSQFCKFGVRLVDELTILYKEAAMKRAREEVRMHILQILILLQQ